eukprot:6201872-Pleurochrysis_carterae.AAC.3
MLLLRSTLNESPGHLQIWTRFRLILERLEQDLRSCLAKQILEQGLGKSKTRSVPGGANVWAPTGAGKLRARRDRELTLRQPNNIS